MQATKRLTADKLHVVIAVMIVAAAYSASAQDAAMADSNAGLIKKCQKLVDQGRQKKAIKLLEAANDKSGGKDAGVLTTLSETFNSAGEHGQAEDYARKAVAVSKDAPSRASAHSELALALAIGNPEAPGLRESVESVREYLALEPAGEVSDRIRVRLCTSRALLPAEHDLSLSTAATEEHLPVQISSDMESLVKPRKIYAPGPAPQGKERSTLQPFESATSKAIVDLDGCLSELEVRASSPAYSTLVERIARMWVFEPARFEGKTVPTYYNLMSTYKAE